MRFFLRRKKGSKKDLEFDWVLSDYLGAWNAVSTKNLSMRMAIRFDVRSFILPDSCVSNCHYLKEC